MTKDSVYLVGTCRFYMIRVMGKDSRSVFYFNEDELAKEFNIPVETVALVCQQLSIEGQIDYRPTMSGDSAALLPIGEWRKLYGPSDKTKDHRQNS
jgi:hypothetical protein